MRWKTFASINEDFLNKNSRAHLSPAKNGGRKRNWPTTGKEIEKRQAARNKQGVQRQCLVAKWNGVTLAESADYEVNYPSGLVPFILYILS